MSKLKYFQALRVEQLNHEIKAMKYERRHYRSLTISKSMDPSCSSNEYWLDDYWLKKSKRYFHKGWAISDAIKSVFGEKYYAHTNLNDENKVLLHQWCELYFQVKDLKEKEELQS